MFVKSAYDFGPEKTVLECRDPSLAKQSFAEEADINTIVRRFRLGGELPVGVRMPTYGDFTGVGDFQSAMNAIALANEAFDAMPADVRARFHNDPQEFVEFCSNDENRAEAEKLGLVPAKVVQAATSLVGATAPTAPPAPAVAAPTQPVAQSTT